MRFCIVLLLLVPLASLAGETVTIALRDASEVSADRLRLGDVAVITAPGARRAEYEAIDLGVAPGAGRSVRLARRDITDFVRRRYSSSDELVWTGASDIKLSRRGYSVAVRDIEDVLHQALPAQGDWRIDDVTMLSRDAVAPSPDYRLEIARLDLSDDCRSGRAMVAVRSAATLSTVIPVAFRVATNGANGSQCPGQATAQSSEVQPLSDRAITRREMLIIESREAGVVLQTTGVAMQDAAPGEHILVRNPRSLETYRVRVVAPGRAIAGG